MNEIESAGRDASLSPIDSALRARVQPSPLDRLLALYLIVSGAALLFPYRQPGWLALAVVHVAGALMLVGAPPFDRMRAAVTRVTPRLSSFLHDWHALLLMPALYTELAVLNRAVWNGRYFDDTIIALEQLVFGGQPSTALAQLAPTLWLSEPLHLAYLSYYFIIFGPPLLLYARGRHDQFRAVVFTLMLTFFAHYVVFVYFPVQGPRYLFPPPGGELAGGPFYRIAHQLLEAGSAQGSAFPSSHVGVSLAQTLSMARYAPALAVPVGVLTTGLALGAVYGGFHYAVDVLVGAALGALIVLCAPSLRRWLHSPAA